MTSPRTTRQHHRGGGSEATRGVDRVRLFCLCSFFFALLFFFFLFCLCSRSCSLLISSSSRSLSESLFSPTPSPSSSVNTSAGTASRSSSTGIAVLACARGKRERRAQAMLEPTMQCLAVPSSRRILPHLPLCPPSFLTPLVFHVPARKQLAVYESRAL